MKRFSKNFRTVFLITVAALAAITAFQLLWAQSASKHAQSSPAPATEKVVFKVEGMTCGGCAIGVKRTLEKQKGVKKVDVSLEKGQAFAEIEKGKVKPEDLAAAVTKIGFKTTVLSAQ